MIRAWLVLWNPVKEIHTIRLKLKDEYAGMTAEEETKLRNKRAVEFLARIGADPHLVSFSSQGKLKPRKPVTR
jgi:hypothetical protein